MAIICVQMGDCRHGGIRSRMIFLTATQIGYCGKLILLSFDLSNPLLNWQRQRQFEPILSLSLKQALLRSILGHRDPQNSRLDFNCIAVRTTYKSFYLCVIGHFMYMQSSDSFGDTLVKSEGRIIYYSIVEDDVTIEEGREEPSFNFKGHGLEELTAKLEEETGLEDVIVCLRNRLNGKLYPLRLDLPPNNATMHIVVVPSSSRG